MPALEPDEIETLGKRTKKWVVDSKACPLLKLYGIGVVGMSEALPGFRFVRARPEMSILMAASKGRGRALIGGRYEQFAAGMAYLMPPRVLHAYAATGRGVWRICWVCYNQSEPTAVISAERPKLVRALAEPLEDAIRGLYREMQNQAEAPIQKLYVELIHKHCMRIGHYLRTDDRLLKLWSAVEADLMYPWTLEKLAREAGINIELLRTLSKQSTGRSPMKQVTFLRMQSAAVALSSTAVTVSEVSQEVGYDDSSAFSVAFKRHLGMSPSDYRNQKQSKLKN